MTKRRTAKRPRKRTAKRPKRRTAKRPRHRTAKRPKRRTAKRPRHRTAHPALSSVTPAPEPEADCGGDSVFRARFCAGCSGATKPGGVPGRSEERRVGKERSGERWAQARAVSEMGR